MWLEKPFFFFFLMEKEESRGGVPGLLAIYSRARLEFNLHCSISFLLLSSLRYFDADFIELIKLVSIG